jgi:hypothetical protein
VRLAAFMVRPACEKGAILLQGLVICLLLVLSGAVIPAIFLIAGLQFVCGSQYLSECS